jgi:hypothetical protein
MSLAIIADAPMTAMIYLRRLSTICFFTVARKAGLRHLVFVFLETAL